MPLPLLPILAGGASLLSGLFGNRAKNNQAKEQANLYNNWLKQYMGTGQNLMAQAQAGGWNPFGPQTSTSQSTTSSSGGGHQSTTPTITGNYQGIDALMRNIMTGRLGSPSSLPAGYASNRTRAINQSYEGADQAARNMAASRGLSGEQAYAVASPSNRARAGDIADMRGEIPLLERQMQNEDVQLAANLQKMFGTGQDTTSSQWSSGQSSGSQTNPFSADDLSALMRIMVPPSPQQGTQTGTSNVATGLDSLAGLLGDLMFTQSRKQGQQATPGLMAAGNAAAYSNLPAWAQTLNASNPF
jgi:hypothetical protein